MTTPLERELLITRTDESFKRKGPTLSGEVVYGFYTSPCRYEEGYYLVSLHQTKAGAWRAKQKAQWALELQAVEQKLYPRTELDTKDEYWRRVDPDVGFLIKAIVVSP